MALEPVTLLSALIDGAAWSFRVDANEKEGPVPQGSHKTVPIGYRTSKGTGQRERAWRIIDSNHGSLAPWRRAVARAAIAVFGDMQPLDGDVFLCLSFQFPYRQGDVRKDGTLKETAPLFKRSMPDIDKLERAILDALHIDAKVLSEDGRVVGVLKTKTYSFRPGVVVGIWESRL